MGGWRQLTPTLSPNLFDLLLPSAPPSSLFPLSSFLCYSLGAFFLSLCNVQQGPLLHSSYPIYNANHTKIFFLNQSCTCKSILPKRVLKFDTFYICHQQYKNKKTLSQLNVYRNQSQSFHCRSCLPLNNCFHSYVKTEVISVLASAQFKYSIYTWRI